MSESKLKLMQLPDIVLDEIFSHLTYDEISKLRLVSHAWNNKCKDSLTRGFYAVEKYHAQSFKHVKAQLPRRESERRNHSLARHCDILTAIETRLSMLSMTFSKYIDVGLCCFIPGKVIDEIFRILHFIKEMKNPPRAHEILQELRDISSMAMEHFDEKIVPKLKETLAISTTYPITGGPRQITSSQPSCATNALQRRVNSQAFDQACQKLRVELIKHTSAVRKNKIATNIVKKSLSKFVLKSKRRNFRYISKIAEQASQITELNKKVSEQGTQMAEMKRQFVEWDHKFTDLNAKLNRVPEPEADLTTNRSKVTEATVERLTTTRASKRIREAFKPLPDTKEELVKTKKQRTD